MAGLCIAIDFLAPRLADHLGGVMTGARLAFLNAVVRACQHDADFWLSRANLDKATPTRRTSFSRSAAPA